MELDVLKKSWESLDKKVQQATAFNHKLVESIISSRVTTTVDKIKKMNNFFFIVLTIEIVLLIAIFLGNPFDFRYTLQYVPFGLLLIGIGIAFVNLTKISSALRELSPGSSTIDHYLKSIVSIYDRNKRFEKWFGVIFLSTGLVVPFAFLPQKLDRMSLSGALLDTGIMITVTLIIYIAAFKFGAFKNPHKEKLERDLAEWNELKALANEIS
jgi:hypothetical protein